MYTNAVVSSSLVSGDSTVLVVHEHECDVFAQIVGIGSYYPTRFFSCLVAVKTF